ncbi:tetratricopeptide repeat protein [Tenacibaculum sp. TC6]|uniref:tetratricopeptide repeat protein n=1 Tax=Tenacibaculum sp. TC6 TaxID=3423223 RepID=UPI003D3689BD
MKNSVQLLFLYGILLLSSTIVSQSGMNSGFSLLEQGEFAKAKLFFEAYLKDYPENKTAKLCYGRAVGLSGNPKQAKVIFDELLNSEPHNLEFRINAAECLLWDKQFEVALIEYKELEKNYDPNPIIELGLANTYSNLKKFETAIHHYNKGILLNPKILGIYIGLAYTYQANNQDQLALETIDKALLLDVKNQQLINLKKSITQKYTMQIVQKNSITSDSGHNQSINSNTDFTYPLSTKTSVGAFYHFREASNTITRESSQQGSFGVKASYQLTNKIKLTGNIGNTSISGNNSYRDFIYTIGAHIKLSYNQDLNIYNQKEYHNFNVQLVNSKISQNHFYANYHIISKVNIGLFTQYYHTIQSDNNNRNLLFSSLYYLLKKETPLKVGLNTVIMGFDKERAEVYFSPKKYFVFEGFIDVNFTKPSQKLIANGNAAYGYQIINNDSKQQSFRIKANLGYKFSNTVIVTGFAEYSNQAIGNASGFEFNEIGIVLKCHF